MLALSVENVSKSYDKFEALKDVSFSIEEGEIFGLLGPNGAGKTSLISIIMTLVNSSSGSVKVFGYDVEKKPKEAKFLSGCVPQELIHHGFFNVEEILRIHSGYYGLWFNQKRIEFLLDRLGLKEHRHKGIKQLSGGMKRRLLIAKALVHEPKLLLLDEPTAGVDVELRAQTWEFIKELKEQGVSIVLTTHYLEEAESLCERVSILNKGKIITTDKPSKLVEKFTKKEVLFSLNSPLAPIKSERLISQNASQILFHIQSSESLGELIDQAQINMHHVSDIKIREGRLEDAFQNIVGAD